MLDYNDVHAILERLQDPTPETYLQLSRVNRLFKAVFLADSAWQKWNLYSVKNIANDYLQKQRKLPGKNLYYQLNVLLSVTFSWELDEEQLTTFSPSVWKCFARLENLTPRHYRTSDLPPELNNNRDFHLQFYQKHIFADINEEFNDDRELVDAVLLRNGVAIIYASPRLRGDPEVASLALKNYADLMCVPLRLHDHPKLVLMAVSKRGADLKNASERLRNDREVVLAAVNQCGMALQFASDRLKDDREVVLAAVSQDSSAIQFASDRLRTV